MTTAESSALTTARRRISGLTATVRSRAQSMPSRRRGQALALAVVLTTAVSVWLRLRGRTWIVADMIYDDAYFARSAGFLEAAWC